LAGNVGAMWFSRLGGGAPLPSKGAIFFVGAGAGLCIFLGGCRLGQRRGWVYGGEARRRLFQSTLFFSFVITVTSPKRRCKKKNKLSAPTRKTNRSATTPHTLTHKAIAASLSPVHWRACLLRGLPSSVAVFLSFFLFVFCLWKGLLVRERAVFCRALRTQQALYQLRGCLEVHRAFHAV
jgi:hypothetical protein